MGLGYAPYQKSVPPFFYGIGAIIVDILMLFHYNLIRKQRELDKKRIVSDSYCV